MSDFLIKKITIAAEKLFANHNANQNKQEDLLIQAQQNLSEAYNILSNVSDPELIDIAILNLKVAEKRYDFLIRELKRRQTD